MFLKEFVCVWQLTKTLTVLSTTLKIRLAKKKEKRLSLGSEEKRKMSLPSENGLAEKDISIGSK